MENLKIKDKELDLLFQKVLPPEDFGEDSNVEELYNRIIDLEVKASDKINKNTSFICEGCKHENMTLDEAIEEVQKKYHYDIKRCIQFHWREIAELYAGEEYERGYGLGYEQCEKDFKYNEHR